MTAAFEYEEPAIDQPSPTLADADPTEAALAMINNGPDVVDAVDSQEENVDTDTVLDSQVENIEATPTLAEYTDDEWAELRRVAEEEYAVELQQLETEHAEASVARAQIADQLKAAKNREKLALEKIRQHMADGPNYPESRTKPDPNKYSQGEESSPGRPERDGTSIQHASPEAIVGNSAEQEVYYSQSTASFLVGIEGLGKKKLTALAEAAPTVRDLFALQIQASKYNLGDFKEVLPDGFGQALADRIDEKMHGNLPLAIKESAQ
jgi:hypothetical protein